MMDSKEQRVGWIDTARAFAMFLIVWGHALRGKSALFTWLYTFNVPFFIIIAGMVFSVRGKDFKSFFKRRFASQMVPYFVFSIISIVIYTILGSYVEGAVDGGDFSEMPTLSQSICGMLWGNCETGWMRWNVPLWFLPMFFLMQLLAFGIVRTEKSGWLLGEFVLFVICAWLIYDHNLLKNIYGGGRQFFTFSRSLSLENCCATSGM